MPSQEANQCDLAYINHSRGARDGRRPGAHRLFEQQQQERRRHQPAGSSVAAAAGSAAAAHGATTYKIGFIGALSGANAQLGINEKQGAQLAIDQANASGKYKFKVTLDPQDSEGDPAKAPAAATALISDPRSSATSARRSPVRARPSTRASARPARRCRSSPRRRPSDAADAGLEVLAPHHPERQRRGLAGRRLAGPHRREEGLRARRPERLRQGCRRHDGQPSSRPRASGRRPQGVDGTTTKNYDPIAQTDRGLRCRRDVLRRLRRPGRAARQGAEVGRLQGPDGHR